ncbi:MAG: DUF2283 domain-containing protein [Caldilineaceae bacterium]
MSENTKLVTPDWLFTVQDRLEDGQSVQIEYDREGDTLEIIFAKGAGRGLELSAEIILRYDVQTGLPLSLILLSFSKLMQPTEFGPESFLLSGLKRLSAAERERVMQILTSSPVNRYLRVSALSLPPRIKQLSPIVYLRQQLAEVA